VDAYDMFLVNYPHSLRRQQAMERLIEASLASYKGPLFDSSGLVDAGQRIRKFQKEFPAAAERLGADALLVRVNEGLALKAYYSAQWYVERGEKLSAVFVFQRVVHDFPHTAAARLAMTQLADMGAPLSSPQAQGEPIPQAPGTLPAPATGPAGTAPSR